MPQLRSIEIDFDIHRLIEGERKGFDEPPYLALRRLLGLPPPTSVEPVQSSQENAGSPWTDGRLSLDHGTLIRMEYDRGRQVYEGKILDGNWVVAGRTFDSPSGAASELAVTKRGESTKLNGWLYWKVKRATDKEWVPLRSLRPKVEPLPLSYF